MFLEKGDCGGENAQAYCVLRNFVPWPLDAAHPLAALRLASSSSQEKAQGVLLVQAGSVKAVSLKRRIKWAVKGKEETERRAFATFDRTCTFS